MAAVLYDFNGIDTAAGSGVPTPAGLPPLEIVSGSWRRLNNRAHTDTARTSNPILAVEVGAGDVDQSLDVSPDGGDALYLRVTDAANWLRLRVRRYLDSYTYYVTEYQWYRTWIGAFDGHTQTSYAWSSSSSTNPISGGNFQHTHYVDGEGYVNHTMYDNGGSGLTGATRQDARTGSTYRYQVILEKSTAGAVTNLGTATVSAPSKLRTRAVGSSVQCFVNNGSTPVIGVNEAAFLDVARHAIGRGPSEYDGQALDNWSIDGLNTPPNAPNLLSPANDAPLDLTQDQVFRGEFSDDDIGDSCTGYEHTYWQLDASDNRIATVSSGVVESTEVRHVIPGGTFLDGTRYEWAFTKTFDRAGTEGPSSVTRFFTAATPLPAPLIVSHSPGDTFQEVETLEWSTSNQAAYQVRVLDETGAVVYDSGQVDEAGTRQHVLTFPDNGVERTIDVRVFYQGLWSARRAVSGTVTYLQTNAALVVVSPVATMPPLQPNVVDISITNPPADEEGEPEPESNRIYITDPGKPEELRAVDVPINSVWRYWNPPSGFDGITIGRVRVETVATNGTKISTAIVEAGDEPNYYGGGY